MRYLITEKQLRLIEQEERALNSIEVALLKKLNQEKEKGKLRTKPEIRDYVNKLLPYLGLPEESGIYYTELFRKNYRKDGKYEELSKSEFIDPKTLPGLSISNTLAKKYTSFQMPFKGSNLDGFWRTDSRGVKMYVVVSYGWYPIYIFKDGIWYETVERYSSSTGRQMSNSNPWRWSDELKSKVFWASKEEMKQLLAGATHQDFLKSKIKSFEEKASQEISQRKRSATTYGIGQDFFHGYMKIKFKIKNLKRVGDRAFVDVDVYGVENQRTKSLVDYLNNEMGVTKEKVEARLIGKLGRELEKYIGPPIHYYGVDYDPTKHLIDFNFNHINQIKPKTDGKSEKDIQTDEE